MTPIRRVVTANNTAGKSYFLEDGPSPSVKEVVERPGYRVTNIWRTTESPALVNVKDTIEQHAGS